MLYYKCNTKIIRCIWYKVQYIAIEGNTCAQYYRFPEPVGSASKV